jgi:hypothetical protein
MGADMTDPDIRLLAKIDEAAGRRHGWRDQTEREQICADCGQSFAITSGEVNFSETAGIPLPSRCRRCRPTRRAARDARQTW